MPTLANTEQEVKKWMDRNNMALVWSQALAEWRKEFYKDYLNLITLPEVEYDTRSDRYKVKFTLNGQKFTVKATGEVVNFILHTSNKGHIYYGFKTDKDGMVVDVVAEQW